MKAPDISICVPVYNGEKYLDTSFQSILDQKGDLNYEILIVDDGSTDASMDLARSFQSKFPERVRIEQNPVNLGLVGNWNRCLSLAQGKWIQFLFQDDQIIPEATSMMFQTAIKHDCKLVLCDRKFLFEDEADPKRDYFEKELIRLSSFFPTGKLQPEDIKSVLFKYFIRHNFLGEPVCGLFHRSLIDQFGSFDEKFLQIPDFEFWLRMTLNVPVAFLNEPLVRFRIHGQSTSRKNESADRLTTFGRDNMLLAEKLLSGEFFEHIFKKDEKEILGQLYQKMIIRYIQYFGLFKMRRAVSDLPFTLSLISKVTQRHPGVLLRGLKRDFFH